MEFNKFEMYTMSADDMQLGQTEVCTDTKPSLNNLRHNHTHSATHNHNHGHNHNHLHGVLIGTMQSYGNNLIESFKTEPLCQVQCMDCQKYFNNEEQLTAHRMVHHAQTNSTNQVPGAAGGGGNGGSAGNGKELEKVWECGVCMKTFSKHSSWWKHKKCHTGERAYKCYICEKSFTQQANLHRHMFVHSGLKPHACKICNKCFSQAANLVKHQVIHTNEKPFKCSLCPKQFTQRANLKKHEMVHTGERPYQCPICKKAYAQYANMKKHMLVHAKSKQSVAYLCAKCKVLFDTITIYDEHLESCKNNPENYNFDEVLEKLSQQSSLADAKDIVGRQPSSSSSASSNASGQQTASIIVVTAAMTSTSMSSPMNASTRSTIVGNAVHGPNATSNNGTPNVTAASLATISNVTGLATISMPANNFKIIKYPRNQQTLF